MYGQSYKFKKGKRYYEHPHIVAKIPSRHSFIKQAVDLEEIRLQIVNGHIQYLAKL